MLLVVFCASCLNAAAQQNPLKFSYLTVDDGLSHTDVKEIKQDRLGFIWIATLYGLDRFDGHEIKRFYNTNVAKNSSFKNRIRVMCLDENDNVWLGSEDGIQYFDPRLERYTDVDDRQHDTGKKIYTRMLCLKGGLLATLAENKLQIFRTGGKDLQKIPVVMPGNLSVTDLMLDDEGNVWMSTDDGVWVMDRFFHFKHFDLAISNAGHPEKLFKIFHNKQNRLIVVKGITLILTNERTNDLVKQRKSNDSTIHVIEQQSIPGASVIHDVIQDKRLNYWVCTDAGLFMLDQKLKVTQTITTTSFVNSLNTNYLDKIFIDRSACMWVCTFGNGVDFCDLNAKLFYTFQHNTEVSNTLSGNHIRSILEEAGHIVWMGTRANGLNEYDYNTRKFTFFDADGKSPFKLKSNEIDALALDNEHNLWVGSDKGIDIINKQRNALFKPPGFENFPAHSIQSFAKDCYGNMWFGSYYNGFGVITHNDHDNYVVKNCGSGSAYQVWADPQKPELMVSTINGLQRLIVDRMGNIVSKFEYKVNDRSNSMSSDYIFPVKKQNKSAYWVGTIGGGLDYLKLNGGNSYHVKIYDGKYGVFNDVETLETDDKGNVWMGGNGLERFDIQSNKVIRFDKNDGLQSNSFKVGASFKGSDGRLYFGGTNGVNYFFPDSIKLNNIPAHPVFTGLIINNKDIQIDPSASIENTVRNAIPYSRRIGLNYLQNNFIISFSAMHYANSEKCQFRYRLLGLDKEWRYTNGKNPTAAYTNLDYNNYTLVLEATNNDGIWSAEKAMLDINITPPWWKSTFAKAIYLLIVISVLLGIYIYQARWFRLKQEIAVRDVEEKKREEMHLQREELYQQQLQFFANISHEFRTPLTLILGPLENLVMENVNAAYQHTYGIMYRNAKRLVNLINELMNFRKVADNAVKLNVAKIEVLDFVMELFDEFKDLADNNKIDFFIKLPETEVSAYLDRQVAEKILFNLLNNAFKYTATGGKVTLELLTSLDHYLSPYNFEYKLLSDKLADGYVYFKVADTGVGISQDSMSQIFDRYYRINTSHIGSGIGLALVKSLTLLHKGNIYISSERQRGTEIIIALPTGIQNYSLSERAGADNASVRLEKLDNSVGVVTTEAASPVADKGNPKVQKQHILLVEDNDELRSFLKEVLQKKYIVYEAVNGKQGFDMALDTIPDLIVSDVMMPVMNGIELCRLVKAAFETSHIPFLFLSAKDALEAKLEGMESGADYYIAKPVSIDLLLLTIHNLFEQKHKLKLRYTKDYYAEATELVHSSQDKVFIDKLIKLIEANIHSSEMDVDYLCNHMFTSRSKLYQKIKSISGQSIVEFIRTIRLKKAAYIMTHEDVTQNEIVDRIGIQSLSYFQKAFKKEFGKTPSQFIQSIKEV